MTSNLAVPNKERGRRNSWHDKWRWRSKSRESSQNPPKRELSLDPSLHNELSSTHRSDIGSNLAAAAHNERVSTVTASTQSPSGKSQAEDNVQARDNVAIIDVAAVAAIPTDLWSAAYREAVFSLGEEVDSVFLKGERIENLLTSLEEANGELAGSSLFRRGVQRLQTPLRNLKLALDIASPLTSIEPTASTAVGVVSSVTAVSLPFSRPYEIRKNGSNKREQVAIAICGAEESLNAQIISMLEHVAIIDECDTLGQKLDAGNAIHKVRHGITVNQVVTFSILTQVAGARFSVQRSAEILHCRNGHIDQQGFCACPSL